MICVSESTVTSSDSTPLKVTTGLVPTKPPPTIVTDCPITTEAGLTESIRSLRKVWALVDETFFATTVTLPDVAPAGTTASIRVADTIVKLEAGVAPKLTAVAAVRPTPLIDTDEPVGATSGLTPVTLRVTVNGVADAATPVPVVTVIVPLVAPAGTVARIWVGETRVTAPAACPLKATATGARSLSLRSSPSSRPCPRPA